MEPGSMSFIFIIFFAAVAAATAGVALMVRLFFRKPDGNASTHGH